MFNRRWYGNLPKSRHASLGLIRPLINLSLLFSMVVLLITSALISRSVFRALQLEDSFTAGRIHALAAYVVLIIVSLHLGMHGSMIINTLRNLLGIKSGNAIRRGVLRGVALGIAGYGIYSSFVLGIGSKLTMQLSLEWWDFEASTWDFFVYVVAVMGLYAFIAHYAVQFYPVLKSRYTPSSVLRRLG
jgi:hypothetical protein